jgi:hypothetical protein
MTSISASKKKGAGTFKKLIRERDRVETRVLKDVFVPRIDDLGIVWMIWLEFECRPRGDDLFCILCDISDSSRSANETDQSTSPQYGHAPFRLPGSFFFYLSCARSASEWLYDLK